MCTRAADVVLVVEVVVVVVVVDRPVACERTVEKREPPNIVLVKVSCVTAGRKNAD